MTRLYRLSVRRPRKESNVELIVKVQRPLETNEDTPMLLVYDKARAVQQFVHMTPDWMRFFGERDLKVYVYAEVSGGQLKPVALAPFQEW